MSSLPSIVPISQGSMTFVNTGKKIIGITAAHVVTGLLQEMKRCPTCKLFINKEICVEFSVIEIDETLDIATLEINSNYLEGKTALSHVIDHIPQEGSGILVSGFPAQSNAATPSHMVYGLFHSMGLVKSVNHDRVGYEIERAADIDDLLDQPLPEGTNLGGISGGPMINFFQTKGGLWKFVLVGVISQAHQAGEYIIGTRTNSVRADGTISRSLL